MILNFDFETFSPWDLKEYGPNMIRHPDAAILWMSYQEPGSGEVSLWSPFFGHFKGRKPDLHEMCSHEEMHKRLSLNLPLYPFPRSLADHVLAGGWVQAHNINFDLDVWNVLAVKYGAPKLPMDQVLCSMELCYYYGLPGSLEMAAPTLDPEAAKDIDGQKSMLVCAKPGKPTKALPYGRHLSPENQWRNGCYCYDDTVAMTKMLKAAPPHPIYRPDEARRIWATRKMNDLGIPINLGAVRDTLDKVNAYKSVEEARFAALTDGLKPSQSIKFREFLQSHGFPELDGVGKDKLEEILPQCQPGSLVEKVVQAALRLSRKADAKLNVMLNQADERGFVRNGFQIYRSHTRRWAGVGLQPANMFTSKIEDLDGGNPDLDDLVAWCFQVMKRPDAVELLEDRFKSNFLDIVAALQRSFIQAPEGFVHYDADYSAVEARAVMYLARQENALEVFRSGGDIYAFFAGEFLGKKVEKSDPERKLGKAPVLGLGFGMSECGFVRHLIDVAGYDQSREYGVSKAEFLKDVSVAQRKAWAAKGHHHPREFARWPDAKAWDFGISAYATYHRLFNNVGPLINETWEAFMRVANRSTNVTRIMGTDIEIGREDYGNISFVYAKFQTGGVMWFPDMEARKVVEKMPWGEEKAIWVIEYNRVVTGGTVKRKGPDADVIIRQKKGQFWVRHRFSKNEAIENCVQSFCSDYTANSLALIDADPRFSPTMVVHDQVVAIGEPGHDEAFRRYMFDPHPVDPGFPLEGSLDVFRNFRKG